MDSIEVSISILVLESTAFSHAMIQHKRQTFHDELASSCGFTEE